MWTDPDLRRYSFFVHFLMSSALGMTMVVIGLCLYWQGRVNHRVDVDLSTQVQSQSADVRALLANQAKILEALKR